MSQNEPKWGQNGQNVSVYFGFVFFRYRFFICAFFDREHAETLRNGIKSEKKGDLTPENDQNVISRSK